MFLKYSAHRYIFRKLRFNGGESREGQTTSLPGNGNTNVPHIESIDKVSKFERGKLDLDAPYPRFAPNPHHDTFVRKYLGMEMDPEIEYFVISNQEILQNRVGKIEEILDVSVSGKYEIHTASSGNIEAHGDINPIVVSVAREVASNVKGVLRQHTGVIASARYMKDALAGEVVENDIQIKTQLRLQLAQLYGLEDEHADHVFLAANGMEAITCLQGGLLALSDNELFKMGQVGVTYLDTGKLHEDFFGYTCHRVQNCSEEELQKLREDEELNGIFVEFPSNPHLLTPDVIALQKIAREKNIPFIIDDTFGTPVNTELLRYADVVVSSLTKYHAGEPDVMGGSIVVNPSSPFAVFLKAKLVEQDVDTLYTRDAQILLARGEELEDRVEKINDNTWKVVAWFREHKSVYGIKDIYYADEGPQEGWKGDGRGGVFSIVFEDPLVAQAFYDYLDPSMLKAASFGYKTTLVSAYALLAHFGELKKTQEELQIDPFIMRISIGIESTYDLIEAFEEALIEANKHPVEQLAEGIFIE